MNNLNSIKICEQGNRRDGSISIVDISDIKLEKSDYRLIDKISNKIFIEVRSSNLMIKTMNHVGVIPFSGFNLVIIPKIKVENIIQMINYSGQSSHKIGSKEILAKTVEGMDSVIIREFFNKVEGLQNQGMARSYVSQIDNRTSLRGRLLVRRQLLNTVRGKVKFVCKHDKFEYDVPENRIILFCLQKCRSFKISPELKAKSISLSNMLQEYGVKTIRSIPSDYFARINYTPSIVHYRSIHELCKMILENISIKNFYTGSITPISPFLIDMSKVFEKFVERLFHNYFNIKRQHSVKSWIVNNHVIPIKPDILICKKGNTTHIIDAKYKINKDLSEDDRYQLSFYGHRLYKKPVYAILPKPPDDDVDNYVLEPYGHEVRIKICFLDIDNILSKIDDKEYVFNYLTSLLELASIHAEVVPHDHHGKTPASLFHS